MIKRKWERCSFQFKLIKVLLSLALLIGCSSHRSVSGGLSTDRHTSQFSGSLTRKVSGAGVEALGALSRAHSWFKESHQSVYIYRTTAPSKPFILLSPVCTSKGFVVVVVWGGGLAFKCQR